MEHRFKTVMIIDDNEMDRYIAEKIMQKTVFADNIICMESAIDALGYLSTFKNDHEALPQLIFLDINMPKMNGFDFLDEYSKLPDDIKRNCIIMMLTTSLNREDRERSEANEYVYKFLSKPLDKEKLNSLT